MNDNLFKLFELISDHYYLVLFGDETNCIQFEKRDIDSYYLYKIFNSNFNEIVVIFNHMIPKSSGTFLKIDIKNNKLVLVESQEHEVSVSIRNNLTSFCNEHKIGFKYINANSFLINNGHLEIDKFCLFLNDSDYKSKICDINKVWDLNIPIDLVFKVSLFGIKLYNYSGLVYFDDLEIELININNFLKKQNKLFHKKDIELLRELFYTTDFRIESTNIDVVEILKYVKIYNKKNKKNNFIYEVISIFKKNNSKLKPRNLICYDVNISSNVIIYKVSNEISFLCSCNVTKETFNKFPIFENIFTKFFTTDIIDQLEQIELDSL